VATEVKMPQLGETVVEGTITRWLKHEGEAVGIDEPLVEVSTDKVDSEIPSPAEGTVARIHAGEGETVRVGSVIAEIAAAGEAAVAPAPKPATAPKPGAAAPAPAAPAPGRAAPTPTQAPGPAAVPAPPAEAPRPAAATAAPRQAPVPAPGSAPAAPAPVPAMPPAAPAPRLVPVPPPPGAAPVAPAAAWPAAGQVAGATEPLRGVLSPIVRRLANERGIDLSTLRGTGTGGRITKQDVLAAAPARAAPAPASPEVTAPAAAAGPLPAAEAMPAAPVPSPTGVPGVSPAGLPPVMPLPLAEPEGAPAYAASVAGDELVQVSHMRRAIAEHMVASHLETARAWNTIEIDMTRVHHLRTAAGPAFKEREGFSLTWMPFVAKAVIQALLKYPEVNATWNGDGTITRKHYVNLGIAVALANGLIVPVIKNADGMNLVGLARAVRDLAERARAKRLVPDDVQGGTFTITNPGPFGSIMSVPIINMGQAGILAFDAVKKRPVVLTDAEGNDSIAIRHMVFLSISWDHRVIDGSEAARFLAELKALLEGEDFSAELNAYLPGAR
jgi:pyruvate dehydrogenase E2 component (dihydrolipoamide acetyltransferase)